RRLAGTACPSAPGDTRAGHRECITGPAPTPAQRIHGCARAAVRTTDGSHPLGLGTQSGAGVRRTGEDGALDGVADRGEIAGVRAVRTASQNRQAGDDQGRGDRGVERGGAEREQKSGAGETDAVAEREADHRVENERQRGIKAGQDAGAQSGAAHLASGPPGERADERQDEGMPSDRAERRRREVLDQAGHEARGRPAAGPPLGGEGERREQNQVGYGVGQVQLRRDRRLQRERENRGGRGQRGAQQGSHGFLTSSRRGLGCSTCYGRGALADWASNTAPGTIASRGSVRGGCTTTATVSTDVASTYGVTSTVRVRAPGVETT